MYLISESGMIFPDSFSLSTKQTGDNEMDTIPARLKAIFEMFENFLQKHA